MATAAYFAGPSSGNGAPAVPENGSYRIITNEDGTFLQLKNATTGQWHSVFTSGESPNVTLQLGPAEE